MAAVALSMVACTQQKKAEEPLNETKALVLYYSQTGTTKAVAEEIQKNLNCDIECIEVEVPYDGTYMETIERCGKELESGEMPAVKPLQHNVADYDVIFLGYPVWYGTYCNPIAGLIKNENFEGKKVITFVTFGSGGLAASTEKLQAALPQAEVNAGYGVRSARIEAMPKEVFRFLVETCYIDGEIEPLAAFMEHHPVDETEAEIFNQACGDYQFPLGSPVDVAVRQGDNSTDYEFSAKNENSEDLMTIYVTVENTEGAKPVFTEVVR